MKTDKGNNEELDRWKGEFRSSRTNKFHANTPFLTFVRVRSVLSQMIAFYLTAKTLVLPRN